MQLILGRAEPVFPHFIMTRRLPTKQLLRLGGRAIQVLQYLEKAVHPRWPMTFEVAKRGRRHGPVVDCCPAAHASAFE